MTTAYDDTASGADADLAGPRSNGRGGVLISTAAPEDAQPQHERRRRRPDPRRALVVVGRTVLWSLLALLLVRGILDLVGDLRAGAATLVGPPTTASPEDVGAYAATFAADYLTFDPADLDERTARLAGYLAPGLDPRAGWDGVGTQTATAAVPLSSVVDDDRTIVTVAARVVAGETPPRWTYLAVPVHAGAAGGFVVVDLPATVAPPLVAQAPARPRGVVDDALSDALRPTLTSFFEAWAAGEPSDLERFVSSGRTLAGLDGTVELAELTALEVLSGGERREALARVRWRDRLSGAALEQAYDLVLVADGGRWYVESVGAGAAPAVADPAEDSQ